MPKEHPRLKDLIIESGESDSPDDVLYRFVSSYREGYEISGCEDEAICLLVNFSVRREGVKKPLDRLEAIQHLQENNFRLIKRYVDSLRGYHTHNIKFPLSYLKGNVRCHVPYDEHDPYMHSGSVQLDKRYGYAQNAANTKAAKTLLAEFYLEGRRTSLLEEGLSQSKLFEQFIELISDSVNSACDAAPNGSGDEPDIPLIEQLKSAIQSLPEESLPDTATDPQIFAATRPGRS